jgi:hypothetical protein
MATESLTIKIVDNVYDLRSLIAVCLGSFAAPQPGTIAASIRMVLIEEAQRFLEDLFSNESQATELSRIIDEIIENNGRSHIEGAVVGNSGRYLYDYIHCHGADRLQLAIREQPHDQVMRHFSFNEDQFWPMFLEFLDNRAERSPATTNVLRNSALIEDIIAAVGGEESDNRLTLDPSIANDLVMEQIADIKRMLPPQFRK